MTFDVRLILAEMRASELLTALQDAVIGAPRWRLHASILIREINDGLLPAKTAEALREVDARKRAAEIMQEVSFHGGEIEDSL